MAFAEAIGRHHIAEEPDEDSQISNQAYDCSFRGRQHCFGEYQANHSEALVAILLKLCVLAALNTKPALNTKQQVMQLQKGKRKSTTL